VTLSPAGTLACKFSLWVGVSVWNASFGKYRVFSMNYAASFVDGRAEPGHDEIVA
jgi:hypothetical protein